jgi:hypothetical protein
MEIDDDRWSVDGLLYRAVAFILLVNSMEIDDDRWSVDGLLYRAVAFYLTSK